MRNRQQMNSRQQGAALIISLVLLTMLTTLGVTAMRSNLLDVRIHNNTTSKLVALQCAEAALLAGENWIVNTTEAPTLAVNPVIGSNEVWALGDDLLAGMKYQNVSWWSSNAWSYGNGLTTATTSIGCTKPPFYIVEAFDARASTAGSTGNDIGFEAVVGGAGLYHYFRITAYGVGALDTAPVVLQSTFAQPYN